MIPALYKSIFDQNMIFCHRSVYTNEVYNCPVRDSGWSSRDDARPDAVVTGTVGLRPLPRICQLLMVADDRLRHKNAYNHGNSHLTMVYHGSRPRVLRSRYDVCGILLALPSQDRQIPHFDWTITRSLTFLAFGGRNATGLRE